MNTVNQGYNVTNYLITLTKFSRLKILTQKHNQSLKRSTYILYILKNLLWVYHKANKPQLANLFLLSIRFGTKLFQSNLHRPFHPRSSLKWIEALQEKIEQWFPVLVLAPWKTRQIIFFSHFWLKKLNGFFGRVPTEACILIKVEVKVCWDRLSIVVFYCCCLFLLVEYWNVNIFIIKDDF